MEHNNREIGDFLFTRNRVTPILPGSWRKNGSSEGFLALPRESENDVVAKVQEKVK